jgi:predicted tellurium resistance membrane protein TerC
MDAIKIIIIADLAMSLDNVLALGALAQTVPGSKDSLIIIGLVITIPIVMYGAQILMKLMDRFPIIIYIGTGVLGFAAAELIGGDKVIGKFIGAYEIPLDVVITLGVVAIGHWRKKVGMAAICEAKPEQVQHQSAE